MKVYPTMQTIEVNCKTVTIGGNSFDYDSVQIVTLDDRRYVECYLGGILEDRFLLVD
jgi:hypothetical protein